MKKTHFSNLLQQHSVKKSHINKEIIHFLVYFKRIHEKHIRQHIIQPNYRVPKITCTTKINFESDKRPQLSYNPMDP